MAFSTTAKVIPPWLTSGYAFTPTIEFNGSEISGDGGAYTRQLGLAYFIAPGLVYLTFDILLSAKGSGSGNVRMRWPTTATDGTALPSAAWRQAAALDITSGVATAGIDQISARSVNASRVMDLIKRSDTTSSALQAADIASNFSMSVGILTPYTP